MRATAGLLVALVACGPASERAPSAGADVSQQASALPSQDLPDRFGGIGRAASASEIRAWDIDVNPDGVGLPAGRGGYRRGAVVYAAQCAVCHGPKGEGLPPNPRLVGTDPRDFSFGNDPQIVKTIGNYWPHATTLFDYINRAMPFNAPSTLPADDVYALVAFLLAENGIIDTGAVMDRRTLPGIRMPSRDRFVPDDRTGGTTFR